MVDFLIVEDDAPTLAQLSALLSEEFPGASIDVADNVAAGNERLRAAALENRTYGAALLDFKLPLAQGESPEIDHSLCERIRNQSPGTLIIHMTAFGEDPAVLKHIAESHSEPQSPGPVLISKSEIGWPTILLRRLRTFLYSRDIEDQMDRIFGHMAPATGPAPVDVFRRSASRAGGVTHHLAILIQSIEEHWEDLTDTLKKRIHATFVVDTSRDKVRVSLL